MCGTNSSLQKDVFKVPDDSVEHLHSLQNNVRILNHSKCLTNGSGLIPLLWAFLGIQMLLVIVTVVTKVRFT